VHLEENDQDGSQVAHVSQQTDWIHPWRRRRRRRRNEKENRLGTTTSPSTFPFLKGLPPISAVLQSTVTV